MFDLDPDICIRRLLNTMEIVCYINFLGSIVESIFNIPLLETIYFIPRTRSKFNYYVHQCMHSN